jgi:hypothetical protein
MPSSKPPTVAPVRLPSPPRITTEKALSDARSPIEGYARKTGPSSAPAAAASAEPNANVAAWTRPIETPMSAAVSRSWNVARIARPSFVWWISNHALVMSPMARTSTMIRKGAIATGPSTNGAVGNGWGIDFATPPHTSSSPFCIAIHTPIITSIVVSIDSLRSGRSSVISQSHPSAAPATIAARIPTMKLTPASASAANATYAPSV